jgi:predicted extracellular nuclease
MSLVISGIIDGPLTGGLPKAIELTALADIADLSIYGVGSANNGGGSDGEEFTFPSGSARRGDVIYVATESAEFTSFFGFAPDYISGAAAAINGDDAIELFENGTVIDLFGDIDVDGTGQLWDYLDGWAYRSASAPAPATAFDPADWVFSGTNALDGQTSNVTATTPFPAGQYAAALSPADPVINEFVASTTGADVEYIEIKGAPNADLPTLTLLEIEGDIGATGATGVIDEVIAVGTTDADGYWTANLTSNTLENGSLTLLLVENFTGTLGMDLDTDDDGVFDSEPWGRIVDSVAISDGGTGDQAYAPAVLGPNYDGVSSFAPGGASRIPDGTETDTAADWVRNDFDLAGIPGFTGSPEVGEALNTPGAPNEVVEPVVEPPPITMIHDIQGNAATWGEQFGRTDATPFFGATLAVSAVVVGDFQNGDGDDMRNLGGFYLQEEDADADGDATTSEGIFVFEGSGSFLTDVNMGDKVTVIGVVTEFFGETQITATSIDIESSGNVLPTAAQITFPIASAFENGDGQLIADLEAYEGMRVSVPQDLTVGDLFNYGRFGEIGLSAIGEIETFTQNNSPDVAGFAAYIDDVVRNTIVIDDGRTAQNPDVLPYPDGAFGSDDGLTSGDTVQDLVGVVRYSRGSGGSGDENYRINPTEAPTFLDTTPREETPPDVGGRLKVASFNVLNFFNGDGQGGGFPTPRGADTVEELARQTDKLVAAIASLDADVVGLIEIENDGYGPESAIAELVDALNAAGGSYAFVDPGTPGIGTDAIAVGFIYDTTSISLAGAAAILDKTVDARFDSDNQRPSLAQTFVETETGASFTAVVNHLKSKGSPVEGTPDDEDQGDGAGNANTTRLNAAEALEDWLATDPTGSGDTDFLIIGDLNAYRMEDPIQTLLDGVDDTSGTEDDLVLLTEDNTYGFPADLAKAGQVQAFGALDYAIASGALAAQVTGAGAWNINSVEPTLIDYNLEFKPDDPGLYAADAYRSSDHDPVIIGLDLDLPVPPALIARVEFVDARGRDLAITTIDGVEVGFDRLRMLQKEVEIDAAGLTIEASDGQFRTPEFVTTAGAGIGVWSVPSDRSSRLERELLNDSEVLSFELEDIGGLGDALEVEFEFAKVRGSGDVELGFYNDGIEIDRVLLAVTDNAARYDLAGNMTFDRVEIGVEGDLGLGIAAVEFLRLEVDELTVA